MSLSTSSTETTSTDDDFAVAVEGDQVAAAPPVVDPGHIVRVTARFRREPERIVFSHLPPGADKAERDVFGELGSQIKCLGGGFYQRLIDTRGVPPGTGWWHLQGEGDLGTQRARLGQYVVRDYPPALFGRKVPEPQPVAVTPVAGGYEVLGEMASPRMSWKWVFGAAALAALLAL